MLRRRDLVPLAAATMLATQARAAAPDEIVVAQGADAYIMDPGRHSVFPTANILFQIYDALITIDPSGAFRPALALSWSNPDPLTWRFVLRRACASTMASRSTPRLSRQVSIAC